MTATATKLHPTIQIFLERFKSDTELKILDFQSGVDAPNTELLKSLGFKNVFGSERSDKIVEGVHLSFPVLRHLCRGQFDVVIMTDILHQSTEGEMKAKLLLARAVLKTGGTLIANYGHNDRIQLDFTVHHAKYLIGDIFGKVERYMEELKFYSFIATKCGQ